jgi:hypothetical protein
MSARDFDRASLYIPLTQCAGRARRYALATRARVGNPKPAAVRSPACVRITVDVCVRIAPLAKCPLRIGASIYKADTGWPAGPCNRLPFHFAILQTAGPPSLSLSLSLSLAQLPSATEIPLIALAARIIPGREIFFCRLPVRGVTRDERLLSRMLRDADSLVSPRACTERRFSI